MRIGIIKWLSGGKWLAVARRPLPRRIWIPVVVLALAVLAGVLAARRYPLVREALRRAFSIIGRYGVGPLAIDLKDAERRIRALAGPSAPLPLDDVRIVIRKKQRLLELYSAGRLVKSYVITMGRHADAGPKTRKGDGCTPEGRYFICTRNGQSRFHLFLGLNYPAAADAARAVAAGLITEAQRKALAAAESARTRPAWDTPLGGEIGIHGGGTHPAGWTLGCIALANPDIEELWAATALGTPVELLP